MRFSLKLCIFCRLPFSPSRPSTQEHIWSKWMRELLPRGPGTQRISRFNDGEAAELLESREYSGVLQNKFKPRVVCRDCNTGWMSALEDATKPILHPLIREEARHLTRDDQKTLATWACLKNMVAEFSDSKTRATAPADFDRMYKEHLPPERATVWLGQHTGADWTMRYRHHGMRIIHASVRPSDPERDPPMNGQVTTFTAGPVVLVLLTLPEGFLYGAPIANGRLATRIRQIYPAPSPFDWPLGRTLTDHDVFELGDGMASMFRRLVEGR